MYKDNRKGKYRLLLVEDELDIAEEEKIYLEKEISEISVEIIDNKKEALAMLKLASKNDEPFDIVIIDFVLKENVKVNDDSNGLSLLESIANFRDLPIPIIRSALPYSKMYGYLSDLGIRGYVAKEGRTSFELKLLKSKIKKELGRIKPVDNDKCKITQYDRLSFQDNQWLFNGKTVTEFTKGDILLLKHFVNHQGRIFSHEDLFDFLQRNNATHKLEKYDDDDTKIENIQKRISERVRHIRKVLDDLGYTGKNIIVSKRGLGYQMKPEKELHDQM